MRAVAKVAADCSADFEALKGGGGGGAGGGSMNLGGADAPISMNADAGAENVSAENISTENVSSGENSNVATSENISANENSSAQNENPLAQGTNSAENEDSDSAADIMDKYIYAIRAIQDEWLNFMKSDKYKEMPEDIFEAAELKLNGGKNFVDAILAYKKSMNYRFEQ